MVWLLRWRFAREQKFIIQYVEAQAVVEGFGHIMSKNGRDITEFMITKRNDEI